MDIQRILNRAAEINIDLSTLNLPNLSDKSRSYLKVLRSKHKDSLAYDDYLKSLEKSRNDYYMTVPAST